MPAVIGQHVGHERLVALVHRGAAPVHPDRTRRAAPTRGTRPICADPAASRSRRRAEVGDARPPLDRLSDVTDLDAAANRAAAPRACCGCWRRPAARPQRTAEGRKRSHEDTQTRRRPRLLFRGFVPSWLHLMLSRTRTPAARRRGCAVRARPPSRAVELRRELQQQIPLDGIAAAGLESRHRRIPGVRTRSSRRSR